MHRSDRDSERPALTCMAEKRSSEIVVSPRRGLVDLDLATLWHYRDLVLMFVRRDFVAQYKQTVLGPLWYVVQPLLTTSIFTVVFSQIASIPTDGIPPFLFYLVGLAAWQYFAGCMTKVSETFIANAAVFGKVYFPRLTIPIAVTITNMVALAIHLSLVLALVLWFASRGAMVRPSIWIVTLPLLVLQMAVLGLAVGTLVASLTTRYRDLALLVGFGVQLWMFATPVVYPLSQVPRSWQWLVMLNPMTPIVETFRLAVLGAGTVAPGHVLISVAWTVILLGAGLVLFTRAERTAADTL